MRVLRNLGACLALALLLAGCGSLQQQGTVLRFGAFVVDQTTQVDDVAEGRRGNEYYGEVRRHFDAGEQGFVGWNGMVTLSVRTADNQVVSRQVPVVNGFVRDSVTVPFVAYSTLVCIEMPPGVRIAHQKDRPAHLPQGKHGACTPQGQALDHVQRGLSGHVLVIAIVPRPAQTVRVPSSAAPAQRPTAPQRPRETPRQPARELLPPGQLRT